ncbi:MAG: TetR/AcrR family transcriptional regulator [Propionibacteriaceae bacterium]|nr:TetR/AcrR family transcriptional regulator [Propionibacteriaceae bacterium]
MGRHQLYTSDQILDAAMDAVAIHGRAATLAQVCAQIGAPSGSIYHRFGSRDEVMMRLWMRSIHRFHGRLFEVGSGQADAGDVLVTMAVATAQYCRHLPREALSMTLFSHERLMASVPDHLRDEAGGINDEFFALLLRLATERFPHLKDDERLLPFVFTAVVGLCYGLVRPYIIDQIPVPEWLDSVIHDSCRAALAVGDTWQG